jgi:uncharacterized protein (UPF0218 family)
MVVVYAITPELRVKLKKPFGTLLCGTSSETMDKLNIIVKREKPPKIVTVGDTVSRNLHESGIISHLSVTDNKSMRKRTRLTNFRSKSTVHIRNPQGTITQEAITAVREALLTAGEVHLVVDGEEDLLTLIAVIYAPEESFVIYGQPYEGVVLVEVTPEKKAEATKILEAMAIGKAK